MISYISSIVMPIIIFINIFSAFSEKKKTFDLFLKGAKEGIINFCEPFLVKLNIPREILPLAILRPISGSGSIAIATEIMKNYGTDTLIGLIASVIMGATETTIYTIAVYTGSVKIKNTRFVLKAALLADAVGMLTAVAICRILS